MHNSAEITVIGYVYGDLKFPSQKYPNFVTFSLSVTEKTKDKVTGEEKKNVAWYECQTSNEHFNKIIKSYVTQGTGLFVRGEPKYEAYLDKEGNPKAAVKINIHKLNILSYAKKEDFKPNENEKIETNVSHDLDDDIPF